MFQSWLLGGFALNYRLFLDLLVYCGKTDFCGSLSRFIQTAFAIQALASEVLINMCTHLYWSINYFSQLSLVKQNQ